MNQSKYKRDPVRSIKMCPNPRRYPTKVLTFVDNSQSHQYVPISTLSFSTTVVITVYMQVYTLMFTGIVVRRAKVYNQRDSGGFAVVHSFVSQCIFKHHFWPRGFRFGPAVSEQFAPIQVQHIRDSIGDNV